VTPQAQETLIESALVIAQRVANAKARPPIQVEDLFSAGNEAAWEAAEKWTGEGTFEAFARTVISRRITDEQRRLIGRSGTARGDSIAVPVEVADREPQGTVIRCPHCGKPSKRTEPSPRELEVWERVARGMSIKEIGADLGIADKTAAAHLYNLRVVLNLKGSNLRVLTRMWMERKPG